MTTIFEHGAAGGRRRRRKVYDNQVRCAGQIVGTERKKRRRSGRGIVELESRVAEHARGTGRVAEQVGASQWAFEVVAGGGVMAAGLYLRRAHGGMWGFLEGFWKADKIVWAD